MSPRDYVGALDAYRAAVALCRGDYQRAIVEGSEALSGASLRGRARDYASRYAASRRGLMKRLSGAEIACAEVLSATGERTLVWGSAACRIAALAGVVRSWRPEWPEIAGPCERRVGRIAIAACRASLRGDERAARAAAAVAARTVRHLDREHAIWERPYVAMRRLGAVA